MNKFIKLSLRKKYIIQYIIKVLYYMIFCDILKNFMKIPKIIY